MRMRDAVDGFFVVKVDLAASTVKRYEVMYRIFVDWLGEDVEIKDVTADQIRRFLDYLRAERGVSDRTVHDYHAVLSSLWSWAVDELGVENPVRQVPRPTFPAPVIVPFTRDEVDAMLKAARYTGEYWDRWGNTTKNRRPTAIRDTAIILVLLDTGLRVSELCRMTLADYYAREKRLHVRHGKGNKRRVVYLGNNSSRALWRYTVKRKDESEDAPLIRTNTGRPMDRNNVRHTLARIGDRAGVEGVHPHRFRHTFAVSFLRNGGNVFALQRILGHEQLSTVQVYLRLAQADIEEMQRSNSPADRWKL